MVLGDLNARVGVDPIEGVIGNWGVPGRNDNGVKLIEVCMERELAVSNTYFKKKDINKFTWIREARGAVLDRALMDYLLIGRSYMGRVLDVRVLRGAGGGISDHYLVEGRIRAGRDSRKRGRKRGREVLRAYKLNEKEIEREYQNKLSQEWESLKDRGVEGVEVEWVRFRDAVMKCAREVCGVRRLGGTKRLGSDWWCEEVQQAVEDKKSVYNEWLQNGGMDVYERYKMKRREVKRMVRQAKRRADERWATKVSSDFESNKKMFWKEVKKERGRDVRVDERVKSASGEIVTDVNAILGRWAEHFEQLLNAGDEREAILVGVSDGRVVNVMGEENDRRISQGEIKAALKRMKAGKAPGLDGCPIECLKRGGRVIVEWLERLLNVCFSEGSVPEDWRSACVVPIYKGKGDKWVCGNYRGISMLCATGKLYGRVLIERVREGTDSGVGDEQCGFRAGRGCMDQVFVVRQVCEKYMQKGKEVFWAFMDLEKAYDRVDREALWKVLMMYGVGGSLLRAVKAFYVDSRACVRAGGGVSDWFDVRAGLRQGCVMSPWLFNIYMDGVVREVNAKVQGAGLPLVDGSGREWRINQLLFADDTALVADSVEQLRRLVVEFERVCERRKLRVNAGKSKVMRCGGAVDGVGMDVRLNGEVLEEVSSFKYLGCQIASDGRVEQDVRSRVTEGRRCLGTVKGIFRNRHLGMRAKRQVYEGVIVPTVLYGAESWSTRVVERNMLDVFEMRCLRGMLGVTLRDRMRNEQVRERVNVKTMLSERADQRVLNWYGHMIRMEEGRVTKRTWSSDALGVGRRGRPRMRWMDGVSRALGARNMSVEQGVALAWDRSAWREIVRANV